MVCPLKSAARRSARSTIWSRPYEGTPAFRTRRPRERARALVLAAIVALGPLAWLAWNAHAHGDALHFFERVARFKRALGEGTQDTLSAFLLYPRLLLSRRPDVLIAVTCALVSGRLFTLSGAALRRRWTVPLVCAAAQLAFLAYGNVRDGAPAHHPERALLGTVFLTAAFAADVLYSGTTVARGKARIAALASAAFLALSWVTNGTSLLEQIPGTGATEVRTAQIAAGKALIEYILACEADPFSPSSCSRFWSRLGVMT